jgi:hypothetical protein
VLVICGMDERLKLLGDHYVFISRFRMGAQSFSGAQTDILVVVPSFRPSHAPWTTPAGPLEHTSQFGTMEPCPFTDCGLVNLGWALAQGSRRATERWARQGSARCSVPGRVGRRAHGGVYYGGL